VVGQDRFAAGALADRGQLVGDEREGIVPADRAECAASLRAIADERGEDAMLAVQVIGDLADLAADEAIGDRVAAVAVDLDDATVLDGDLEPAQVGAVEWAGAAADLAQNAPMTP
jgi:hypothetical protein